jgi:hypothetical protein
MDYAKRRKPSLLVGVFAFIICSSAQKGEILKLQNKKARAAIRRFGPFGFTRVQILLSL